jgi:glycerophosphoryl diester phosphodiesterase
MDNIHIRPMICAATGRKKTAKFPRNILLTSETSLPIHGDLMTNVNFRATIRLLILAIFVLPNAAKENMTFAQTDPIVIAHRGASGYLPEHTLAAKALAYGMGADFIEQDVVLTKDDVPVVLHDIHLDTVSNVAEVFPDRAWKDGRFYAIEFTVAEIKQLRATERIDRRTGRAVYENRFPVYQSSFQIPTLAEEIELIQGLNKSTGRDVGIYPEIKNPDWHRKQNKDISKIVLETLQRYGYTNKTDRVYLQCFDAEETRRIREVLKSNLKLVQLISASENENSGQSELTDQMLENIAQYADGVGPAIEMIVTGRDSGGEINYTQLVEKAHRAKLVVHPYTLRSDALPDYVQSYDQWLNIVIEGAKCDGVFTDFPDTTKQYLLKRNDK